MLRLLVAIGPLVQWQVLPDHAIIKDTKAAEGTNDDDTVSIFKYGVAVKDIVADKTGRHRSVAWYKKYKTTDVNWLSMGGFIERSPVGTFDMKELEKDGTHYIVVVEGSEDAAFSQGAFLPEPWADNVPFEE